jgi:hypothetical protein
LASFGKASHSLGPMAHGEQATRSGEVVDAGRDQQANWAADIIGYAWIFVVVRRANGR